MGAKEEDKQLDDYHGNSMNGRAKQAPSAPLAGFL